MDEDPITQFFPGEEDVDLYAVLTLSSDASSEDIKKAYRRLALKYHPDKQSPTADRPASSLKFQQIGYAYTILSDDKRRKRYDETGRTDEGVEGLAGEGGWDAYFEQIFEEVTRHKLDEMKKEYQGSSEELDDLQQAYTESQGSIADMMTRVPHSTFDDEARFIVAISKLIDDGKLPSFPNWKSSVHDEKAKLVRKKQAAKEAVEAEELARELGVWDEFYGDGKAGKRRGKGKGKAASQKDDTEEDDTSALQALILKKKQNAGGFLDNLAAKYGNKAQKRRDGTGGGASTGSRKRPKSSEEPEIDDEEFKRLQDKLFPPAEKPSEISQPKAKRQKRR